MKILRWAYVLGVLLTIGYALFQGYAFLLWAVTEALAFLLPMLLTLFARVRTQDCPVSQLSCVVAIPAHNEAAVLEQTLALVQTQAAPNLRIVVVDDASTDKTADIAERIARQDPRVSLLSVQRGGKAKALNQALLGAKEDVFVTLDADTQLLPGALQALLGDFSRPDVEAASGFISVKGEPSFLGLLQSLEYARASMLRIGFSKLRMHEQAPGAFTGFRTQALQAIDGFPDSLTEDYEVIFRLYDRARTEGRSIRIVGSHTAFAVTSVPLSLGAFFRQRQRWFAGFLVTLYRYRSMLFDPRLGVFGMVRLPTKVFDAVAPLVLVLSCAMLFVRATLLPATFSWSPSAFGAALSLALATLGTLLAQRIRRVVPWYGWLGLLLEVGYGIFRALAVLAAYPLALRTQVSQWDPKR
jgi:cellulose synthase/poly-beta-1,6-N-acetylglucosamine synthase-like glycosyltransferase